MLSYMPKQFQRSILTKPEPAAHSLPRRSQPCFHYQDGASHAFICQSSSSGAFITKPEALSLPKQSQPFCLFLVGDYLFPTWGTGGRGLIDLAPIPRATNLSQHLIHCNQTPVVWNNSEGESNVTTRTHFGRGGECETI